MKYLEVTGIFNLRASPKTKLNNAWGVNTSFRCIERLRVNTLLINHITQKLMGL